MKIPDRVDLWRATIFHTPGNPFHNPNVLVALADGGLVTREGKILACGDFSEVRKTYPDAVLHDFSGGFLLPGFVDTHVHYPQTRILGGLGYTLLDWLDQLTLPEESKLVDVEYATAVAREFTHALASHGTTTALVFGSHFADATAALFVAAAERGLRVFSGLVLSDRCLRPELHQSPDNGYRDSKALIDRFHGEHRLGYVVTPRFALSTSEQMLEVCQSLMRENAGLRFQTHINESGAEIDKVRGAFPWAKDYLAVYERFDLIRRHSVLAHNVHGTGDELARLAARRCSIAHCPCSNASLGSGLFPMRKHLEADVHFSLGTDVGGGTGFGMLKEGLQAYLLHRLASPDVVLNPAQLLYLVTRAGAEALVIEEEIGDFTPGKKADFVYLRATEGTPLEAVLNHADTLERMLAALFTLAGAESVRETRVEGQLVFEKRVDRRAVHRINGLDRRAFVKEVGWVFEHSPWIAERSWKQGPFTSLEELYGRMTSEVESASRSEQLALLRAHPDLGSRAKMSQSSTCEQAGAGLDQLTPEEYERLHRLNNAYKSKFGFPFLFAVKGSNTDQILDALERRLESSAEEEFQEALRQVYKIALFRLEDAVGNHLSETK